MYIYSGQVCQPFYIIFLSNTLTKYHFQTWAINLHIKRLNKATSLIIFHVQYTNTPIGNSTTLNYVIIVTHGF